MRVASTAAATPQMARGRQSPRRRLRSFLFKRDASIARDALYWHHEGNRALRVRDWKLVSESEKDGEWELYNLKRDRIESRNLAASRREQVNQLSGLCQRLDDEFRRQAGDVNSAR